MTTVPWQLSVPPSPGVLIVSDGQGQPIATVHGPRHQAALDGVLFLHAPDLLDAVRYSFDVFTAIAAEDDGPARSVAAQARDQLAALLEGPVGNWMDGDRAR